jgi:hypothetical protein
MVLYTTMIVEYCTFNFLIGSSLTHNDDHHACNQDDDTANHSGRDEQ